MKNGSQNRSTSEDDITVKTNFVLQAVLQIAGEFATVSARLEEAGHRLAGVSGDEQNAKLLELAKHIRALGDGNHDVARSIEQFIRK